MKNLTYLFLILFSSTAAVAQLPQHIDYHAVIRDDRGDALVNEKLAIVLSILQGSPGGPVVFSETHLCSTDAKGLVSLKIGSVNSTGFHAIDWSRDPYYLSVNVNGTERGITQLVNVPGSPYTGGSGSTPEFRIRFDGNGITSLKKTNDVYDTDYIARGSTLGHLRIRYRLLEGEWEEFNTREIGREFQRVRPSSSETLPDHLVVYNSSGWDDYFADLEVHERFRVEGDALYWSLHFRNLTHKPLEIGDVEIPLPFNSEARWDKTVMSTQRVVPHQFVSGHASFVYWMRPNGQGPFLVMTPVQECPLWETNRNERNFKPARLEYFSRNSVYIHAAASIAEAEKEGGNWRQQVTSALLTPKFSPQDELTYDFKFQWAENYDGVRDILYREGLFDIHVVPGMTLPVDLEARLSIRTLREDAVLVPEFPDQTRIEYQGLKGRDTRIYRISFSRLGENKITIRFGEEQSMVLEFFVTEPLETLIKKRAGFLVSRQQHRDPSKWYDGLFSEWDAMNKILRGPDDRDGMRRYMLSCDDPGLCKAPYIAAKNVHYPSKEEIGAVEYYIRNFVWGGLQCTDREPYPYGIYGIPDWKVNRESKPSDREGWTGHVWRLFDYPHIIHLYLNMYLIAKYYPEMTEYLDAEGYLERAYGTARAFFTLPIETADWSAYELGIFDEVVIPELIDELYAMGWDEKADWLREQWEKKVEHYINDDPNLFHSEFPYDPTGYESYQAFADYAMKELEKPGQSIRVSKEDCEKFMKRHIAENMAARGWLETSYWQLGSERRLRYMSQLGGWSVLHYGLYYSPEPADFLCLGYASFLSSWCLMSTGTPESNWGYWYPGKENDGAAGSAFIASPYGMSWAGKPQPRGPWMYSAEIDLGYGGALRTASTIVTEDSLFGQFAYGGTLIRSGEEIEVIPRDGLRKRFHVVDNRRRFHLLLDRDGFARDYPLVINESLNRLHFQLERRYPDIHTTRLRIGGLPAGTYEVSLDDKKYTTFIMEERTEQIIPITINRDRIPVSIRKIQSLP